MKLTNLERVCRLVKIKDNCTVALSELEDYAGDADNERDCGGSPGFEKGYYAIITKHSDGSGTSVDMTGCYVGVQLATATRTILEEQIEHINRDLKLLGVELD